MRIALLLHISFWLLAIEGSEDPTIPPPTTTPQIGIITKPLDLEELPTEAVPKVILPIDSDLPDSGPSLQDEESESADSGPEVIPESDSDIPDSGSSLQDEESESADSGPEVDIPESHAEQEPEVDDKPAEEENSGQGKEELEVEAPEEDDDGFIEEDLSEEKIPEDEQPRSMVNGETEEETGLEIDIKDPEVEIDEEESENIAELVITKSAAGVITCNVDADPLIYTSCNLSVWVNEVENSTATNVYQTSTEILESDTVKCKASCSTADGLVTMTARHVHTTIFTMPIIILIAIGGVIIITTLVILIYFINKSRKRKKGYHFPLTDNTVEAYNLETDVQPVTSGNGTQVVVSDSYNLVDG